MPCGTRAASPLVLTLVMGRYALGHRRRAVAS